MIEIMQKLLKNLKPVYYCSVRPSSDQRVDHHCSYVNERIKLVKFAMLCAEVVLLSQRIRAETIESCCALFDNQYSYLALCCTALFYRK